MNTTSLEVGNSVLLLATPIDANARQSLAALSNIVFSASPDGLVSIQTIMNSAKITGVAAGTATITATATATEPDGVTTEQVTGTASVTVTSTATAPPVAASLALDFGLDPGSIGVARNPG